MASAHVQTFFPATDYDLAATLTCGQAFRWEQRASGWEGVVGGHWVRLEAQPAGIQARTAEPVSDWNWLRAYLQLDADLPAILDSFPRDAAMQAGIAACRG